jgi:hypothetical protein
VRESYPLVDASPRRLTVLTFAFSHLPVKKGKNDETNPISFKTCCPSMTNNEKISFFLKSKPYDVADRAWVRGEKSFEWVPTAFILSWHHPNLKIYVHFVHSV